MLRTIVIILATVAVLGGILGFAYHFQWLGYISNFLLNPVWWMPLLWIASTLAIAVFAYMLWSPNHFTKEVEISFADESADDDEEEDSDEDEDADENQDKPVPLFGNYLNPFVTQFIMRPILSVWFAVTLIGVVLLALTSWGISAPAWLAIISTLIVVLAIWWPNQKPFYGHTPEQAPPGQPTYPHMHIPDDYVAIVTWLGNRLPIYLTEGDQPWLPTFLGFGVNRASLYGAQVQENAPVGETDGLVYVGVYVLPIWDSAKARNNIAIENVTRGGSTVIATFLVSFVVTRPLTFAKTTDPILRIADQARAGLRKAFAFFQDIDVTSMKSVISSLTEGKAVRVAITTKTIEHLPEGSVVHNRVGNLLADLSNKEPYNSDDALLAHARAHGHPRFFSSDNPADGEPFFGVTKLSLREKLAPTIRATGGKIVGTVIGNITLSETVSHAAQKAASVGQRRLETIGMAEAQKEARERLQPKEGEESDEFTRLVALASSGATNVKFVHTTGEKSELSRAAATHASLTSGD